MNSKKISIIIITLNEEELIGSLLLSLRDIEDTELIVSDGGSIDRTARVAKKYTDKVIRGERGRGLQLNNGAALATGDILWFLHVDSTPPHNFKHHIWNTLDKPGIAGGAFTLEIDSGLSSLKVISKVAGLRSMVSRIPYGDQGIFVKRKTFEKINGFKNIPLMEDIDFGRRLKREGRIAILDQRIKTCARAWERDGVLRTTLRNWIYVTLFFMGYSPHKLYERYYRKNIRLTMQRDVIKQRKHR
ncbi:MAG: TIGR04283 family arsenosugar biosynthesis glycosyltransferase [Nitrospirae bacterium]|nr:TIGR04283 family arsenosugar biosynthesis glycosyltransferase [Nitrospirota bacterium]